MHNTFNSNISHLDLKEAKVLVIGDAMLDEYRFGETNRISPEAPVQIVKITNIEYRLGGAANVANNIRAVGAQVCLIYACGNDTAQQKLDRLLNDLNITSHPIKIPGARTTVKSRVLSKNQQLIRFDDEEPADYIKTQVFLQQQIMLFLKQHLADYNVVVLSDYAKGMLLNFEQIISYLKEHNKIIILDPKQKDCNTYKNVNILTPNTLEFQAWVGECNTLDDITSKARALIHSLNLQALLITRGKDGILCIQSDSIHNFSAISNEVFDVTGAGDTVAAILAACLSVGNSIPTSAFIANHAAGLVVTKVGTATVKHNELLNSLTKNLLDYNCILDKENLQNIIHSLKQKGKKIVLVNGCYDILHHGHLKFLHQAKSLGDFLVVAVNDDSSVKRLKGPTRPIHAIEHRMLMLANLKMVDWVISFSENTPGKITEFLAPNVLVKNGKNYNHIDEIPPEEGAPFVLQTGGTVHLIKETQGISSTQILESVVT